MKDFLFIAVSTATILLVTSAANADWISFSGAENAPNIAEIHVNDDHVRIDLEIFVRDLATFHRLLPDEFFEEAGIEPPPLAERLRDFAREDLQIITSDGRTLPARLKQAAQRMRKERFSPFAGGINPFTGQRIPGPPEDKRVLYVELEYPFDGKPESLTFIAPLDAEGRMKAAIGFVTYHKDIPINDFRYLPAPSATLVLDWEDPWYSQFVERSLKRWQRGSVSSFVYVEPFEVRHEILARVKDLDAWVDLGLRGDEYIEADENEALKQRIGEFMLQQENLVINGMRLRPILDRTAFVKYSATGSTFLTEPERMAVNAAVVGVIITYLVEEIPDSVTYEWNLWSDRVQRIPTDAIDPAGGLPSYLTPDDNVATWQNFLQNYEPPAVVGVSMDESMLTWPVPVVTILCAVVLLLLVQQMMKRRRQGKAVGAAAWLALVTVAAGVVSYPHMRIAVPKPGAAVSVREEDAVALLNTLLRNVYRSFEFREEADIYDKLATSVHGDLLSEIYLQNRRSLVVEQAGGAQARVKEVEILEATATQAGARSMTLRAKWTALGTVGHWGHIHTRQNRYDAEFVVQPVDGLWKITAVQILEEDRVL